MARYVIMVNYTAKWITNMRESPKGLHSVRTAIEEAVGKLESFYLTLGQYDAVSIADVPDDATLAKVLLSTAAQGHVRTTTMRAFDEAEYEQIIADL